MIRGLTPTLRRFAALAVLAALALASPRPGVARAEDVVTKTDGGKLRGTIVLDAPEEVRIKTAGGVITIPRVEVAKVERGNDVLAQLASKQAALEKNANASAKDWLELGRWCQERELWVASVDCFHKVVRLDPENEDARFELGYRRLGGKWVPESEYFKAKGYVQHEGEWISRDDKEKLDAGLVKRGDEWVPAADAKAPAGSPGKAEPKNPGKTPGKAEPGKGDAGPIVRRPRPLGPRGPRPLPGADAKVLSAEERKAAVEAARKTGGWQGAHSSKYYDFYSNGPLDDVKRLAATMDLMCDEYKRIFAYKSEITRSFPVWLYASQQEFMAKTEHGPGVGGFYDGEKIVGFHGNLGSLSTQSVLFHEGTHQFQGLVFGQNMWTAKIWFIEGLAVYFEASEAQGKKLVTDVIPRERLATVKRAVSSGEYVKLADLIRLEQREFGAFHYAHAWSLIYFLCHGTKGGMERFKKYFEGVKEGKEGVELFEKLFDQPIEKIEAAWKDFIVKVG